MMGIKLKGARKFY